MFSGDNLSKPNIAESHHIGDVLTQCHFDSGVIFDLDNTVMEPTTATGLGSDQWFDQFLKNAKLVIGDETEALNLVRTVYIALHKQTAMKAVEDRVVAIINVLQDIGIPVLALTARNTRLKECTLAQLNQIGIDFSKQWGDLSFELDIGNKEEHVSFQGGVIHCQGSEKSRCLNAFLEKLELNPSHLIMIDDKEKYLIGMQALASKLEFRFSGLRYAYLDKKVETFDMKVATKELIRLAPSLPFEVQYALDRLKITSSLAQNSLFAFKEDKTPIDIAILSSRALCT